MNKTQYTTEVLQSLLNDCQTLEQYRACIDVLLSDDPPGVAAEKIRAILEEPTCQTTN